MLKIVTLAQLVGRLVGRLPGRYNFSGKYTGAKRVSCLSYASLQPILEVHSAPGNRVIFTGDV